MTNLKQIKKRMILNKKLNNHFLNKIQMKIKNNNLKFNNRNKIYLRMNKIKMRFNKKIYNELVILYIYIFKDI